MMRQLLTALVLLLATASGALALSNPPAPPQFNVDTTMPTMTGQLRPVHAGDDLQTVINAANGGDVIEIDEGTTFFGTFILPVKASADATHQVIIRSSGHASLPAPGTRAGAANANHMGKLAQNGTTPALIFANGAHHYRIIGLEIASNFATRDFNQFNVICAGLGSACDTSVNTEAQLPHHIVFDRVWVHGTTTGNVRNGMQENVFFSRRRPERRPITRTIREISSRPRQALASLTTPAKTSHC